MSATDTRLTLAEAQRVADELVERLRPYCERIQIVGSVRRRKPLVKDIELLCVPVITPIPTDLFGTEIHQQDELHAAATALRVQGVFQDRVDKNGRAAFGDRYRRLLYQGVALDLFSVKPPAQWGLQTVIRTGPAEFSHRLVTSTTHRMADGRYGLLPPGMKADQGGIWKLDYWGNPSQLIPTPEEADVFALLGIAYLEPEARS